uniref:Putative pol protein n=1 Tax=Zea mays TaxID=4577 RepID=Q8S468_MAIZE|nr:putative pol protein [Zea mays]
MTGEKKMFTSYVKNKDSQDTIIFGDGNQGKVKGLGKIAITNEHSTSNVFLVESLGYNLLFDKSETQGTLKRFLRRAQNEFELKVKKIRSDNGSKFKNLQVEEYLEEEGVKHEFSAPYTPQQNDVVMDRFLKKRRVIKGEDKKNKLWRKKHHGSLQLKSERRSNGITPLTRFWVT